MQLSVDALNAEFDLVLVAFLGLGVLVAAVEFVHELFTGKLRWGRIKEMLASFSVQIPSTLLEKSIGAVILFALFAVYQRIPWRIEIGWGSLIAVIILADFIHYWSHRWEHEIRAMWTWHSVHHSSPVYNFSTSFRVVFFRALPDMFYYLPLVVLGFHPLLVVAALSLVGIYQIWLHNDLIGKLGPIGWVFCTPSHHRVHHGSDEKYLDKNYGGILIIWDRLFGTFQPEEETPTYGLTKPIESVNPVVVHFHEVRALWRDLRRARSWSEVAGYLFGPPGWTPEAEGKLD